MYALEDFKLFLIRVKSQKLSTALTNLRLMNKVLNEASPLCSKSVNDLINKLIANGRDATYINQHIIVIRYYAEFANIPDLITLPYIKLKSRDDFVRATLSDDEVEAFLHIPNPSPVGTQFYARNEMWTLFWYINAYEGFRPGETIMLRKQDCDLGRNVFILPDTKTGHRLVPISFVLRDRLVAYLDTLKGSYLFPSVRKTGKKYMGSSAWIEDFNKRIMTLSSTHPDLARRENLSAYSLRHTFATRLVDEDFSLSKVQMAMGHRKLETTQKYIHMSLKGVGEMIDNDRLSIRHKTGKDIIDKFLQDTEEFSKRHNSKIFMNVVRSKRSNKVVVELDTLD